jgi:hypothetical protein
MRSLWRRWRAHRSDYLYDWRVDAPEFGLPKPTHVKRVASHRDRYIVRSPRRW